MTFKVLVLWLVGLPMFFFGLIMSLGGWLNMIDPERQDDFVVNLVLFILLGLGTLFFGALLCVLGWRSSRKAKSERRERTVLALAERHGGKLTVSLTALHTNLSAAEAKSFLDQCHRTGLAEINLGEGGEVTYRFFGKA